MISRLPSKLVLISRPPCTPLASHFSKTTRDTDDACVLLFLCRAVRHVVAWLDWALPQAEDPEEFERLMAEEAAAEEAVKLAVGET